MINETRKNALVQPCVLSEKAGARVETLAELDTAPPVGSDIFKEMVDKSLQGVIVHREHRPLYVNEAWAKLHGLTVEEALALPSVRHLWDPADDERLVRYATDRLAGRPAPTRYCQRICPKDGRRIWLEVFVRIINWQGAPAIHCTMVDIEHQKRTEGLLQQRQQSILRQVRQRTVALERSNRQLHLYASVIEQVSDRISVIGRDYRYRLTNRANLDYHAKPLDAFLGRHLAEIVGEEEFCVRNKPELDRCFLGETVCVRRSGRTGTGADCMLEILLEPYRETDGSISGAVVTIRDITEAHRLAERLAYQATHDQLTNLFNRRAFEHYLNAAIKSTANNHRSAAFCFIDLDQFKIINDTVGHMVGDRLLKQVAALLQTKVRGDDILARLGGDEFGLLLNRCSARRARQAAIKLIAALNNCRFFHDGRIFEPSASIGIAMINRHTRDIGEVMAQADLACYAAKDNGRNQVHVYQKRDAHLCRRQEEMLQAGGMRAALDDDKFALFAQPIVPTAAVNGTLDHVEILLRMTGENGRLIMPGAFIPAAERYGYMVEIDHWVIEHVFASCFGGSDRRIGRQVNINISGITLGHDRLLEFVQDALQRWDVAPDQVCFEITETAAIRNLAKTRAFMLELKQHGCRFALDDFGSGLSSFNYLKRLPVDYLKIDGAFVRDLHNDPDNHAMVAAIHQMAHRLGIQTVAECVETEPTLEVLRDLGVDFVQGFAVGRPRSLIRKSSIDRQPFRRISGFLVPDNPMILSGQDA